MVTFKAWAEDSEGTEWPTLVVWEGSPRTHTVEEEHCKIAPWPPQLCTTCHTTKCKPRTESSIWLHGSSEDRELAASLGEDFLLLPSELRLPDMVIILTAQQLLKTALPSEHVFSSLDSVLGLWRWHYSGNPSFTSGASGSEPERCQEGRVRMRSPEFFENLDNCLDMYMYVMYLLVLTCHASVYTYMHAKERSKKTMLTHPWLNVTAARPWCKTWKLGAGETPQAGYIGRHSLERT